MKKFLLIIIALALTSYSRSQDYTTEAGTTPEEMVNIITGGQLDVSNITYTGHLNAHGRFWGNSNMGLESGILLASGHVNNSIGPNNTGGKTTQFNTSGDPALTQLCGQPSNDASTLEFDFIAGDNRMSLKIVFASEEWPEYANTSFTDVFGVFLSGPGIFGPFPSPLPDGAVNIALIDPIASPPHYISINNINNGMSNSGPCENCQYYIHNNLQYIQYDAFTTVFEIGSVVIPGETYHIKLSISDIADYAYDSGLFIEAGSLVTSLEKTDILESRAWMEGTLLKISIPDHQNTDFAIYSMTGVNIYSGKITSNNFSYSLENLPKGIYIVSYSYKGKDFRTKVVR